MEAERWQANAEMIAKRIQTIEALIRNTRADVQADLQEVAAVPEWAVILPSLWKKLGEKGHEIHERNGWFKRQVCHGKEMEAYG